MTKRYYEVTAKFGHVGRNNYIIKIVPVIAENGKDAAYKTRWMGRVKHHHKDAIINVREINEEEYIILKEEYNNDPYFSCNSIQEQNDKCLEISESIYRENNNFETEKNSKIRKERVKYKKHKNKIINDDTFLMIRNYDLYLSYECI